MGEVTLEVTVDVVMATVVDEADSGGKVTGDGDAAEEVKANHVAAVVQMSPKFVSFGHSHSVN